jgi:diacylglycerol kinase (ATP)
MMSNTNGDLSRHEGAAATHKQRRGVNRILHAAKFSLSGLRYAWEEAAFRQEALLAVFLVPAAFWLGRTWVETVLLAGAVVLVLVTELLNTCVEAAIDRVGPEWHALSKRAKDMGSAAVLLSLILCLVVWICASVHLVLAWPGLRVG